MHLFSPSTTHFFLSYHTHPRRTLVLPPKSLLYLYLSLSLMTMEVPVITRISGFEAEINRLHNTPSLISRVIQLSDDILRISSFWTWGALILAVVATFGSVLRRTKLVIFRFRRSADKPISLPPIQSSSDDLDFSADEVSDDDDADDAESVAEASSEDDEDDRGDGDFRVAGSSSSSCKFEEIRGQNRKFKISRRRSVESLFSWSELLNGKSVVKSWDGLGLGLEFDGCSSSGSIISLWDLNRNEITSSCYYAAKCEVPAVTAPSPAVVVSVGLDRETKNAALRVWDIRIGHPAPEIFTEWQPRKRKVVAGGLRDDVRAVVVRDIRNVKSSLEGLTESDVDSWWDADAVIVDGDLELRHLDRSDNVSVVSRCRNAVLSYLF